MMFAKNMTIILWHFMKPIRSNYGSCHIHNIQMYIHVCMYVQMVYVMQFLPIPVILDITLFLIIYFDHQQIVQACVVIHTPQTYLACTHGCLVDYVCGTSEQYSNTKIQTTQHRFFLPPNRFIHLMNIHLKPDKNIFAC